MISCLAKMTSNYLKWQKQQQKNRLDMEERLSGVLRTMRRPLNTIFKPQFTVKTMKHGDEHTEYHNTGMSPHAMAMGLFIINQGSWIRLKT